MDYNVSSSAATTNSPVFHEGTRAVRSKLFGPPALSVVPVGTSSPTESAPPPSIPIEAGAIPKSFYERLPDPLRSLATTFDDDCERDVFTLAALVVCGGCMPRVSGMVSQKRYAPAPFILVIAPPASGKGTASLAPRIIGEVEAHTRLLASGDRPKTVLIPANSSASAFIQQLKVNGGRGVVFETEIDTLVSATKQDWGDYSSVLRQAAEHEAVSINRVAGMAFIPSPALGAFLAGTPDQAARMFPSAEDGLFSRFGVYQYDPDPSWRSRRPSPVDEAREQVLGEASRRIARMHASLEGRDQDLSICLSEGQWRTLDDSYERFLEEVVADALPPTAEAIVKRAATLAFRVATIIGVLRSSDRLEGLSSLNLTDNDVYAGIELSILLGRHSIELSRSLGHMKVKKSGLRLEEFLSVLPDRYTASDVPKAGELIGIGKRQAYTYNSALKEGGLVESPARGQYVKTKQ